MIAGPLSRGSFIIKYQNDCVTPGRVVPIQGLFLIQEYDTNIEKRLLGKKFS